MWGVAAGGAAFAAVDVAAATLAAPVTARLFASALIGLLLAAWTTRAHGRVTPASAARLIESTGASFDNLVVTAVELSERPRPVRTEIRDEVLRQAEDRISQVNIAAAVPIRQPLLVMVAVGIGSLALLTLGPGAAVVLRPSLGAALEAHTRGIDGISVRVVPPAYSGRREELFANPIQVSAIAGSRVRLEVASTADDAFAEVAGQRPITLTREGNRFVGEWTAADSVAVAIRPAGGEGRDAKFLSVIVVPDAPPTVRVVTPGRDVTIAGPKGRIALDVDARDDLGLAALSVKFTKASGGGEALTFTEGEVALTITRADDRRWRGRAEWVLDGLELSDGDVLVYQAIARDRNPNGSPVRSEQFLIEVGRRSDAAGAGFALPAEEKKYAISQQMVIYKTEQLIASVKGKGLPSRSLGEGWLDQNRMLAIEQRMVRAEVVFLGGGEVEDEVEEAKQSQDVVEGRLENSGRAEMLKAINFMSRAEGQLNDGKATEALVLERQALRSLELAFDRRRYFLRTLPDRSRIDPSRRLTGVMKEARPWTRDRVLAEPAAGLAQRRALMRDLSAAANSGGVDAALAARVAALDPASRALQQAAVAVASAATDPARRDAVWAAMQAVTTHAMTQLVTPVEPRPGVDPLAGRLADELQRPARGGR
jgi:hypothetical protein